MENFKLLDCHVGKEIQRHFEQRLFKDRRVLALKRKLVGAHCIDEKSEEREWFTLVSLEEFRRLAALSKRNLKKLAYNGTYFEQEAAKKLLQKQSEGTDTVLTYMNLNVSLEQHHKDCTFCSLQVQMRERQLECIASISLIL